MKHTIKSISEAIMYLEEVEKTKRKQKSTTMREDLINEVEIIKNENSLNYSAALEKVVEIGVNTIKKEKFAQEIRAYYQSMPKAEKQKRDQWLDTSWDFFNQLQE